MAHSLVGVVNLKLLRGQFNDEDLTVIQSLLREDGKITVLTADEDDLRFYLWGEEKLNYSILDRIKAYLIDRKYTHFTLMADEYMWMGQKYYFGSVGSEDQKTPVGTQ